jgi:hypothetical protein
VERYARDIPCVYPVSDCTALCSLRLPYDTILQFMECDSNVFKRCFGWVVPSL